MVQYISIYVIISLSSWAATAITPNFPIADISKLRLSNLWSKRFELMLADKGHTAPCLDCAAPCCEHGSHWRGVAWRGVFFLGCSMLFGFQIFTMDPVAAVASGMMIWVWVEEALMLRCYTLWATFWIGAKLRGASIFYAPFAEYVRTLDAMVKQIPRMFRDFTSFRSGGVELLRGMQDQLHWSLPSNGTWNGMKIAKLPPQNQLPRLSQ